MYLFINFFLSLASHCRFHTLDILRHAVPFTAIPKQDEHEEMKKINRKQFRLKNVDVRIFCWNENFRTPAKSKRRTRTLEAMEKKVRAQANIQLFIFNRI